MNAVQFEDVGHTFTCEKGSSPATPGTLWWWVTVSGEPQRYAAFRAEPGDTAANVRPRVLAYYAQLLADRERPRITRPTWAQRKPVAATPAPASDAPAAETPARESAT